MATPDFQPPFKLYEFKGLNADEWIDLALRRCLSAPFESSTNYVIAVDMLESIVLAKARESEKYDEAVQAKDVELRSVYKVEYGVLEEQGRVALASTKFRLLLKKIMDKIPGEVEGVI